MFRILSENLFVFSDRLFSAAELIQCKRAITQDERILWIFLGQFVYDLQRFWIFMLSKMGRKMA